MDHLHSPIDGSLLGPDWRTLMVGDLDGDGAREHIYVQDTGSALMELTAPGCGVKTFNRSAPWWLGADSTSAYPSSGDLDSDGRVDVLGTPGAMFTFGRVMCGGSTTQLVDTTSGTMKTTGIPSSATSGGSMDYDGDGILDLFTATEPPTTILHSAQNYAQVRGTSDWSSWNQNNSVTITGPTPLNANLIFQSMRDINGDGMMDTVFDDGPNVVPPTIPTEIAFFTTIPTKGFTHASVDNLAVGGPSMGPGASFAYDQWRRWIDVNGDGLPDIYTQGAMWINKGGRSAVRFFSESVLHFRLITIGAR